MPYVVRKISGSQMYGVYKVLGKGDGAQLKIKSHHASRAKAMRAVSLLRGVEHGWRPTGAPSKRKY